MAEIRDGDGAQRRRRRRFRSHPNRSDYGVDNFNAGYSEEFSIPSHTDYTSHGRRNTALDDALFGFFMKQSLDSLKRNYSDFCQDSLGNNESKKNKLDGVDRFFFSRFGLKYFFHVVKKLTPDQRAIVQKFGFGSLLFFDCLDLPKDFCRWVADSVDPTCSQISVCGKSLDISRDTFCIVLGLPKGGLEMECQRCGWPYGPCQEKKRKASFLYVYLGEGFLQSMRIPKEISSALNISETGKGKANLIYGYDGNNYEASYYTCKDKRICFRDGRLQFASEHKLGAGSVVLILFDKDNADRLCVSFDRL